MIQACLRSLIVASVAAGFASGFAPPSAGLLVTRGAPGVLTRVPLRDHRRFSLAQRPTMQMTGWASDTWNWGYAVGDAHNEAMRVRKELRDTFDFEEGDVGRIRRDWLVDMVAGSSEVDWEDVKLVLALKWQKAAREGRDGGVQGYGYVMEQMRLAKYEGSEAADLQLVTDMERRLDLLRGNTQDMEAIFHDAAQGASIYKDLPDAHRYLSRRARTASPHVRNFVSLPARC